MDKIIGIDLSELVIPTHSILEMVLRGTVMYLSLVLIMRFVMRRRTGSISVADPVYGVVTRASDRDYPHHGQWGATPVLAMCGALMRAHAAWTRARG